MAKKDERETNADVGRDVAEVLSGEASRRDFLKSMVGGAGVAGLAALPGGLGLKASAATDSTVFVPDAKMMIIHDSTRCVGCRRCEAACSLFHDTNKVCLSTARLHLSRNYNFGPEGPKVGWTRGQGIYGNHRLIADTCLQCPHPVPCATACPQQAIGVDPKTNARKIDTTKCVGCGICTKACPWAMPVLDTEAKKATKCDLCGGDPQCVKICPAGALSYVPWVDKSKETPARQAVPAYIQPAAGVEDTCGHCHGTAASTKK